MRLAGRLHTACRVVPQVASLLGEAGGYTLGQRALLWSLAEKERGAREEPPGSNTGPDIRAYFAGAKRRGSEEPLGLEGGNWCAAGASAALYAVLGPGETAPHGWRAAVVELVEDAAAAGAWHPVEHARDGSYTPQPGDLAIYDRSEPGNPASSWWRHVNRVVSFDASSGAYVTLGANEGDGWNLSSDHNISDPKLLGFVAYPPSVAPYTGPWPAGAGELLGLDGSGRGSSTDDGPGWLFWLLLALGLAAAADRSGLAPWRRRR